jgi:hypothetical protein
MNATIDKQIITLSENYEVNGETKTAKVKLVVDYSAKQFTILPHNHAGVFDFGRPNKSSFALWEAIGKLINMAATLGQRRIDESINLEAEEQSKAEENDSAGEN